MDILEDMRRQRAVYWSPTVLDENAQRGYNDPVELIVRWEQVGEMFLDKNGRQQLSNGEVYLGEDVDELGVLWLSSKMLDEDSDGSAIDELTDSVNPFNNEGAYEIRKFEKTPTLDADDYLRIAYL